MTLIRFGIVRGCVYLALHISGQTICEYGLWNLNIHMSIKGAIIRAPAPKGRSILSILCEIIIKDF